MQFYLRIATLIASLCAVPAMVTAQTEPVRVMVIAGQNNHDWKKSTPYLHFFLDQHPAIEATVNNSPTGPDQAAWDAWRPNFVDYDVVLLNYNGRIWPEQVQRDFEAYIRGGGGAIIVHAANNSFTGWTEYEKMVALLWRSPDYGSSIYLDDDERTVRVAPGQGRGMGHGGIFDWVMTTRDPQHPITHGIPRHWMHARDELYHGQRGPAENVNVLLTAYSDPKHGGTGKHEPIVWWVPYGDGKVVTNVMGHVGELACMQCVGFQTITQRSCQWLAGASVDQAIPDNFPLVNRTSIVEVTEDVAEKMDQSRFKRITAKIAARAEGDAGLEPGLRYEVFDGAWGELPDFSSLDASASGNCEKITTDVTDKQDDYGLVFSGFIKIEQPGEYRFFTKSDDGSDLRLGDVVVVDNDGTHGEQEEGGTAELESGVYPIKIRFFERNGGEKLEVTYAGPGIKRTPLEGDVLLHAK